MLKTCFDENAVRRNQILNILGVYVPNRASSHVCRTEQYVKISQNLK